MNMNNKKKYFYEKLNLNLDKYDLQYDEIVKMTMDEFNLFIDELRLFLLDNWDSSDTPPFYGKSEDGMKSSFLTFNAIDNVNEIYSDYSIEDDKDIIGVIRTHNKSASVVNQFFPSMLKTKISGRGDASFYDMFTEKFKSLFIRTSRRTIYNDSMRVFSRSLKLENDEFINLKLNNGNYDYTKEIIRDLLISENSNEDRFKNYGLRITKIDYQENQDDDVSAYIHLTSDYIKELYSDGILKDKHINYLGDVTTLVDTYKTKGGKDRKINYLLVLYDKKIKLFPSIIQIFRLSLSQIAVNFPPLIARYLYENFTKHIDRNTVVNVYDPSSGWGGRILGAMSTNRKLHYIGTDPNTNNFINELGITRYEYLADYFLTVTGERNEIAKKYFDIDEKHTFDIFSEGSEVIHNNINFQKYKNKLDFIFTSPPYFNREQYSEDKTQSCHLYTTYDDWRDNFLRPTLTTCYEYLKNDRYMCWNISDIRIGNNKYIPLEDDSIRILCDELGMEYKGKIAMFLAKSISSYSPEHLKNSILFDGTYNKYEPIFIFYKK